ncbi:MAG: isochorismatase family protein, partial [Planctomycetaceae bacterium]|nr:isochorismatase family protein [Planctomycetaceae bacterium]
FIKQMRPHVAHVMFSLRGGRDGIRERVYRTVTGTPSDEVRAQARKEMDEALNSFDYRGEPLPETLELSSDTPVIDYFKQFPGLDASAKYNNDGFWALPTPVTSDITMAPDDVVIIDQDGYPPLRDFLKKAGVRHILLTGYATDMCFCKTTAGYENLSKDFNVFLVGDATLATFPANNTPKYATNAHISYAALNQLVTQVSWVKLDNSTSR